MTLRRKQIRHAVVQAIVDAETAVGSRVRASRVWPPQHRELPAASVFTRGESVSWLSMAPIHQRRALEIVVQVLVDANDDVDDQCDSIAEQIEGALWRTVRLEGLASDLSLERIEGPEVSDDGGQLVGGVNLVWEVLYEIERDEAAEPTDDLDLVHVEYETHAARATAEAADDIEIEVAP